MRKGIAHEAMAPKYLGPLSQYSLSNTGNLRSLSHDTVTEHEFHQAAAYSLFVEVEGTAEGEGKDRTGRNLIA